MLVVIGIPVGRTGRHDGGLYGTPALASVAASRAGARVELVGKAGEDPAGDAAVLALGQQDVGHAALLRAPGHPTPRLIDAALDDDSIRPDETDEPAPPAFEPADRADWPVLEPEDVQLALRYVQDVRAIIVAEPMPDAVVRTVIEGAAYLAAPVVVVVADARTTPAADIVLVSPPADPDGAFAEVLGQLGAALDRGISPEEAFAELRTRLGVTSTTA